MGKIREWLKNHKGETVAISTGIATVIGVVIWGFLPEKEQPIKEEWIPPVKKD